MAFIHESLHSNFGANKWSKGTRNEFFKDRISEDDRIGEVVPIENTIRAQIGTNWGQRVTYSYLRQQDGSSKMEWPLNKQTVYFEKEYKITSEQRQSIIDKIKNTTKYEKLKK
jgi:hypothetical protein